MHQFGNPKGPIGKAVFGHQIVHANMAFELYTKLFYNIMAMVWCRNKKITVFVLLAHCALEFSKLPQNTQ